MKNHEDEEVLRIILFRKDFSDSISYFEKSKTIDDMFVRDALIKMGVISYAKPFMKNTGIHKEVQSYRLPSSIVPEEHEWLHQMLMNYRGNFIAHSNFKTVRPSMEIEEDTPIGKMIPIKYIDISFDHWFVPDQEFPEEPPLIERAIQLVTELIKEIPGALTEEEVFPNA
jgi:hypothetical protein